MAFVLDASATLPWFFRDEATVATGVILDQARSNVPLVVPAHWPVEVLNVLLVGHRKTRLSKGDFDRAVLDMIDFNAQVSPTLPSNLSDIRRLATQHRLTAYDAAYLELALRRRLPLATLDTDLAAAARAQSVSLLL